VGLVPGIIQQFNEEACVRTCILFVLRANLFPKLSVRLKDVSECGMRHTSASMGEWEDMGAMDGTKAEKGTGQASVVDRTQNTAPGDLERLEETFSSVERVFWFQNLGGLEPAGIDQGLDRTSSRADLSV
jgi:hypothetical protein